MKDTTLLSILRTFSNEEIKAFAKFAASPFFNKGRNYLPLLKLLRKFHPKLDSEKLSKEHLYYALYPGRKYNDQVMKNLINGLTRLCEEFLFYYNVRGDNVDYLTQLADELQQRRIHRAAEKTITKAGEELKRRGIGWNYFRKMAALHHTSWQNYLKQNDDENVAKDISSLSHYTLISFLAELSSLLEEMGMLEGNINMSFDSHPLYKFAAGSGMKSFEDSIKNDSVEDLGIIRLYCNLINHSLDSKNEMSFEKASGLFRKNFTSFDRWGKFHFYNTLASKSLSLEEFNPEKYKKVSFNLHKEIVERSVYNGSENEPMDLRFFRNMINYALHLGEIDWCEKFVQDYIPRLTFERGRFAESLDYLSKVKYDMFAFKYDVKVLSLKLYYELGNFEEAFSLVDTFKHFIFGNKSLSRRKKEVQYNFLKFAGELLKIKESQKSSDFMKLRQNITGTNLIINKEWLLAKVDELRDSIN